jgi:colanic acid/amylovoran biosynthesis glycosyltransferase
VTARLRKDLPREDRLPSGVKLVRVGFGSSFDKWLFPILGARAAARLKPQIIHAVLESFAGMALVLCRRFAPASKRILTCQSTNTSLLLGSMHRTAHAVTCISSPLIERANAFGRNDAVLIPNGLHADAFRKAREVMKKVPGRILFVGRLEPMKGVDTLLEAFALLGSDSTAQLRIVGDGSLRPGLEAMAKAFDVMHRATFLGRIAPEHIAEEYAAAEIFCGLSRSEALGNVFLEAQAAGCAVIGTNVGGIPDIVKDGETGLLVQPDDPEAAAAALERLLSDASLREHLSKAGIANAEAYDWQGIARKYAEVYREILQ